jgi:hypothetical protein
MLVQQLEWQVLRPPVLVGRPAADSVIERALCFSRVTHVMAPAWKSYSKYIPVAGILLSIFSIVSIDRINDVRKPHAAQMPAYPR